MDLDTTPSHERHADYQLNLLIQMQSRQWTRHGSAVQGPRKLSRFGSAGIAAAANRATRAYQPCQGVSSRRPIIVLESDGGWRCIYSVMRMHDMTTYALHDGGGSLAVAIYILLL